MTGSRLIYLSGDKTLKEEVLREAQESHFVGFPRCIKMYKDLKKFYQWPNMKREIAEFMAKYESYQQVKVEDQKLATKLQSLFIPEWKQKDINMDFVSGSPKGKKGNYVLYMVVDRLKNILCSY